ncbi:unnamed protein product [Symbiodinium sp. CCMP2592]|nr:unnamed protein product [Symbiodinium sp. CCMP2592]
MVELDLVWGFVKFWFYSQLPRPYSFKLESQARGETVRLAPVAAPVPAPVVCSPPVSTTPGSTLTNPSPQVVAKPLSDAAGDEADDYEWCEDRHQAD